MDEQLKQQLAEFMSKMLAAAEQGATWASGQVPLVIQEKLLFSFWSSMAAIVVGVICIVVALVTLKKVMAADESPLIVLNLFGIIGGSLLVIVNAQRALKIVLAPRLYIVE